MNELTPITIGRQLEKPVLDYVGTALRIKVKDEDLMNPPVLLKAIGSSTPALQQINAFKREVEARRKAEVSPFNDHVKAINAEVKDAMEPILQAESELKQRVLTWQGNLRTIEAEEERKRQAEEERRRKIQASHEAKGHDVRPDITPVPKPIVPLTAKSTAKTRKAWTWEVEDLSKVPVEYIEINNGAVTRAVGSGERSIPGVKIYQRETLITA